MEEAQDEAAAREYKEYMRQLTHLVHFRVINLGETTIPESKYGISLDHLSKRGLNFDVGGKTPLERKDKFYDLIQPVAGMMRYLRNEWDKTEHIDKLLPFILESTCYVQGDEELYEVYAGKKKKFLAEGQTEQGVLVHKARALKNLLEGVVEMDYSNPGVIRHQPENLANFEPQFHPEDVERLYDVKQEIYRLPDRPPLWASDVLRHTPREWVGCGRPVGKQGYYRARTKSSRSISSPPVCNKLCYDATAKDVFTS